MISNTPGESGKNIRETLSKTNRKPVFKFDLNNNVIAEFDSISDAAKAFGYNKNNLSHACNGRQKTAYGFKWRFKCS